MYGAAAQRTSVRRTLGRQAPGEKALPTVVILVLLAVCLALVAAPWAPERGEAAAQLFLGAAAPAEAVATGSCSREETGSGAHLAGSPVSIMPDRAAAAD